MRMLIAFGALATASTAHAMEPSLDLSLHGGVLGADSLDQISTSWFAAPKVSFWFVPQAGLELEAGFSTGPAQVSGHEFFMAAPTLSFVGNPLPNKDLPVQPILQVGAGVMYKSIDDAGVQGASYAHTRIEALVNLGLGVIVPVPKTPVYFRVDGRTWVSVAPENDLYGSPFLNFLATAGVGVKFGLAKDSDKDGIPDTRDLCVNEPEDFDGFEDEDGCRDPDNDGDGILDVDDQCPDEPEDFDGFEDADGCPDPDNDGDGILDVDDQCPDEPGPDATGGCPDRDGDGVADKLDDCPDEAGSIEFQGCPDTDGDGVPDPEDECPDEAGDPEAFGCPDVDGDGIPDHRDTCPDEAGPADADRLRHDGCAANVYLAPDLIRLAQSLQFSRNSDRLGLSSRGILNDVAELLKQHEDIEKVSVDYAVPGDDVALARRRAAAVVVYLMDRGGIEAGRVVATATEGAEAEEIFLRITQRATSEEDGGSEEPTADDGAPSDEG